jgi:hypothetical protein
MRRVIVQAGGCCGTYPRLWSNDRVYTFEADPLNFFCLAQNCSGPSIVKAEAALSDTTVDGNLISGPEHNVGMHKLGAGQGRPVNRNRAVIIDALFQPSDRPRPLRRAIRRGWR